MNLTLGNWLVMGFCLILFSLLSGIIISESFNERKAALICVGVVLALMVGIAVFFNWYNTSTASGARNYKDYTINLENGTEREITITTEDGREIFHYEGKVDVETNHEGNANYILFDTQEGQRYIIYYGVQDTVLIIEKPTT